MLEDSSDVPDPPNSADRIDTDKFRGCSIRIPDVPTILCTWRSALAHVDGWQKQRGDQAQSSNRIGWLKQHPVGWTEDVNTHKCTFFIINHYCTTNQWALREVFCCRLLHFCGAVHHGTWKHEEELDREQVQLWGLLLGGSEWCCCPLVSGRSYCSSPLLIIIQEDAFKDTQLLALSLFYVDLKIQKQAIFKLKYY